MQEGDALVIEAIDRLSRAKTLDAIDTITKIVNSGIRIITLEDNQEYTKDSLNSVHFYLLVAKVQAAHDYSKRLGTRVKSAWKAIEEKAKAGDIPKKLHALPIWIDKKTLKINEYSEMVKALIDLYLDGEGLREIAFHLRTNYNFETSDRTIGRWLDNPALIGHWRGIKCFDALIPEDKYYEIQEQREKRKATPKQPKFKTLSGLLYCSKCGSGFSFRTQSPRPTKTAPIGSPEYLEKKPIVYGNCRNYLHKKSCSNGATVPEEVALYVFQQTAHSLISDLAYSAALDLISRSEYSNLIKQRNHLSGQRERRINLYNNGIAFSEADLEEIKNIQNKIEQLDKIISDQEAKQKEKHDTYKEYEEVRKTLNTPNRVRITDLLDFGDSLEPALREQIEQQYAKLKEQPFLLRLALKNAHYRIEVSRTPDGLVKLTCSESPDYWVIRRRSQRQLCYIVEHWSEEPVDTVNAIEKDGSSTYDFVNDMICREVEVRR